MAAVNFPNNPSTNDTHTSGGSTWKWDGTVWQRLGVAGPQGAQGVQGATGSTGAAGASGVLTDAQGNTKGGTNAGDSFSGTSAIKNTLFGYDAGTAITTSDENTVLGHSALKTNTAEGGNTAIGFESLKVSTSVYNTAVGKGALTSENGTEGYNTAVGVNAGMQVNAGGNNVMLGYTAGNNIEGGDYNIILGAWSRASSAGVNNECTIGGNQSARTIKSFRVPGIGLTITNVSSTVPTSGSQLDLTGNANFVGIVTAREGVFIPDTKELKLGNSAASPDLKLYSTGTNGWVFTPQSGADLYMGTNAGEIYIQTGTSGNDTAIKVNSGGAVELNYGTSKKLETYSDGVAISGNATSGILRFNDTDGNVNYQIAGYDGNRMVIMDGTGGTVLDLREDGTNIFCKNSLRLDVDNLELSLGGGTDFKILHTGSENVFDASTSNPFVFKFAGNEKVRIDSSGNIKTNNISGHNIITNGAFNINQRSATSSTSAGFKTVDRWRISFGNNSAPITQKHETLTSGAPYDAGFRHSYKIESTGHSGHNNAYCYAVQSIEAQDIANSGWDYTSSSSYINLSFWVKANVSQNYLVFLHTNDTVIKEYCMLIDLTANQWTKVTKAIPGNSGIVMNNDNGVGLQIWFTPALGPAYTSGSTVNTWQTHAGYTSRPDVPTGWWTQSNATFEITGVQLEVGSTDTPFEHKSYAEELRLCQRYFTYIPSGTIFAGRGASSSVYLYSYSTPVPLRDNPTVGIDNNLAHGTFSVRRYRDSAGVSDSTSTPASNSTYFQPETCMIHLSQDGFTAVDDRSATLFISGGAITLSAEI